MRRQCSCILGLIAVVPIAALQFLLDSRNIFSASSPASILVSALILNGLTEETIKMALLSAMPAKQMKPAAFCRYSILSGLTLACFETLIYLISGYENIRLRMFTAVLIHVACAVLDGLFAFSLKHKKADVSPFIYAVRMPHQIQENSGGQQFRRRSGRTAVSLTVFTPQLCGRVMPFRQSRGETPVTFLKIKLK